MNFQIVKESPSPWVHLQCLMKQGGLPKPRKAVTCLSMERQGQTISSSSIFRKTTCLCLENKSPSQLTSTASFGSPEVPKFLAEEPSISTSNPFSLNPSIYITLLQPSEIEAELNDPRIRPTVWFPLSSIPHMPFGYFGEATQQFNLYIFFPRMVHKNPNNNRAITIMPQELQKLWLSEAIFKSLAASMDQYPGTSEYLPKSIEQLRWKSGGHAWQPTLPISPPTLASLLANIRLEISENNAISYHALGPFSSSLMQEE